MPTTISRTIIAAPNIKKQKIAQETLRRFSHQIWRNQYISFQMSWKVKVTFFTMFFFSLISFEPSTIDIKSERHRVLLVKTHRNIYVDIERPKFNLRSRSRRDPSCIWVDAYWRDKHWYFFMSLSLLNLKLSTKEPLWPRVTSDDFSGVTDQHLTLVHHEWLRAHDPERIAPYWCVGKDFNISHIDL